MFYERINVNNNFFFFFTRSATRFTSCAMTSNGNWQYPLKMKPN